MIRDKNDSYAGFTLVESIVTLAIVAILAAMIIPSGLGFIDPKKRNSVR